jgi:SAM-dependent methyltransferase
LPAAAQHRWDQVESAARPSWYLHPLVAAQKQAVHLALLDRWSRGPVHRLLKTDLFEEANGGDQLLFQVGARCAAAIAFDLSERTVLRARANHPSPGAGLFLAADLRYTPLKSGSIDLIFSNSTMDHFNNKSDFQRALGELARLLRPGGQLILTVDNPLNPLYWPLRWASRLGGAPFPLGYTPLPSTLRRHLRQAGLEVEATGTLLHNPRLVSTLLFLALRLLWGPRADPAVSRLLRFFACLERLPTRRFSACFHAACACKPLTGNTEYRAGFDR